MLRYGAFAGHEGDCAPLAVLAADSLCKFLDSPGGDRLHCATTTRVTGAPKYAQSDPVWLLQNGTPWGPQLDVWQIRGADGVPIRHKAVGRPVFTLNATVAAPGTSGHRASNLQRHRLRDNLASAGILNR